MVEGVPEDTSPEMNQPNKYLLVIKPDVFGNRLVFRISGVKEESVGTSYSNTVYLTRMPLILGHAWHFSQMGGGGSKQGQCHPEVIVSAVVTYKEYTGHTVTPWINSTYALTVAEKKNSDFAEHLAANEALSVVIREKKKRRGLGESPKVFLFTDSRHVTRTIDQLVPRGGGEGLQTARGIRI